MDSSGRGYCRCCFSFIFSLGLKFSSYALNKSLNFQKTTSLILTLKCDNDNKDKGIYYKAINLTLSYQRNIIFPINTTTILGFYQGHWKKATIRVVIEPEGLNWTVVHAAISTNTTTIFWVDLVMKVRFKIMAGGEKGDGEANMVNGT
ncbi:hypothetical protein UlMin_031618 [Ulmus minor]